MTVGIDIDRARSALWTLDAGVDRREWVRIGCAAKAAGLAFADFNDWSATASNYGGQGDTADAWRSFKQDGGVNAGTLFHLAREAGWVDPANENKPQRDAKRAAPLHEWWDCGQPAPTDHAYITRKRGVPDGLRMVSWPLQGWAAFKGRSLEGWLMVPVRAPNADLASIQFIGPDRGEKLNAFGCPMAGTFTVGALEPGATAYIVEGIGHAWSLHAVTSRAAVVSFGAANIERAAATIKAAGAVPMIVADRGKEGEAQAAATRQGCEYVVLPADMARGTDVNDLHLERGADAVREVVARATRADHCGRDEVPADAYTGDEDAVRLTDFHAHMPSHSYLFVPTRELWPASSVNGRIKVWPANPATGKQMRPADWLDSHRPIEQMAWHPAEPELIEGRVMQINGWADHAGAKVFNLYRAPAVINGDARRANRWRDHLRTVYPAEADHIEQWLAQRVQQPGVKVNHALVLGGSQGTGKDTLLEPVRAGIGPWNWQDISPAQMLGRFNGWAKAVVVRANEARDLGDVDRYGFYDHSKVYIAAPPDVIRVDEKNLREHYVANVMGVVITTNNRVDGLYLPADDRRHFVAWSDLTRDTFCDGYWSDLWGWYERDGIGDVVTFLRALDIAKFDPKAPPPKTPAFWAIVQTNEAPESGELRDLLERSSDPDATTIADIIVRAESERMFDLAAELRDRKNRRSVPHKFERVGYVAVRNPSADDGLFKIGGKRQAVYAKKSLPLPHQVRAARELAERQSGQCSQCSQ